jgi:hypothetical protein
MASGLSGCVGDSVEPSYHTLGRTLSLHKMALSLHKIPGIECDDAGMRLGPL